MTAELATARIAMTLARLDAEDRAIVMETFKFDTLSRPLPAKLTGEERLLRAVFAEG
jgi:hypothetical protein